MRTRPVAVLAGLAVAAVLMSGCRTDAPVEPDPEPTGFATEEEAFAAAEETYLAYIDASNQIDLADPASFEAVFDWTTGDANAADRKAFSQMHADGWHMEGVTRVPVIEPGAREGDAVTLLVCQDVSDVDVSDSAGDSVVPEDHPDLHAMTIHLTPAGSATGWLIDRFTSREGEPLCSG